MTRTHVAILLGLISSATTSFADWGRDDTALLAQHITECLSQTPGHRTQLEPITYYVRGQIRIGLSGENKVSQSLYFVPFQGSGALTIKGADPVANSVNGPQYSIPARLQTRIVHGVVVGGDEVHSGVPTDDDWYARFPAGVAVCWIEFNEGSSNAVRARTRYDSVGSWASDPAKPHKYLELPIHEQKHWPTVTYQGIPLKYAEPVRGTIQDFPEYRWTRVDSGSQTSWEQSTVSPYVGTQEYPGLFGVPSHSHTNDWTWGITFHDWDADCAMARVASIEREQYSEGPVGGPLVTTTRNVTVNFLQNPFSAKTGGDATLPNKKQRFSLMNAPEFLDEPGEMVFNPSNGRIYFVCPNMSGTTLPDTEANKLIEVAWPTGPNDTTNWGMPITIGSNSADQVRQLTIENIMVGTGRGVGIQVERMAGESNSLPIKFYHCKFRNQGFQGLSLKRCKKVRIEECEFEDGLRGHLKIDAGRDFTTAYNATSSPPINDVINLTSDGVVVKDCLFRTGGVMWPYNGALEMTGWNIGTRVLSSTFADLSGIAIRINGALNVVDQNTITDCVKDITDYGAVYLGRSLVQLGNHIGQNLIQGIKWRGRPTQERVAGSLEDDVCGVYCDDYICGTLVRWNNFSDCESAIISNGGRFNVFDRNCFQDSVVYPFRTNVGRGSLGDSLNLGAFRYYFVGADGKEAFYQNSKANQLYGELRNLYMACKTVGGETYNVFDASSAWTNLQTGATFSPAETGIYSAYYAYWYPASSPDDRKDLVNLIDHLDDSISGQPTWDDVYSTALPFKDHDKNSLRRIQYSGPDNVGAPPNDWFLAATSATVSGAGSRKWIEDYSGVSRLLNYNNIFAWNDFDFGTTPARHPAYGLPDKSYFTSYRDWWTWKNENYMTDDYGYQTIWVPLSPWE